MPTACENNSIIFYTFLFPQECLYLNILFRYFIKEGRVSEAGTHDELLALRGGYYEYVQMQALSKKWEVSCEIKGVGVGDKLQSIGHNFRIRVLDTI